MKINGMKTSTLYLFLCSAQLNHPALSQLLFKLWKPSIRWKKKKLKVEGYFESRENENMNFIKDT